MKIITNKDIKGIKDIVDLQGQNGNYDYDEYMLGLYNGMEMILSMIEKREPLFRKVPQSQMLRYQESAEIKPETVKGNDKE